MSTSMRSKLRRKWNERRQKGRGKYLIFHGSEENYISNGAWILEQSISMFHGRANPIRHISVDDLNNMKVEGLPCHKAVHYNLYQGSWEGRAILVKKPCDNRYVNNYLREIVVATQMTTHKNAHKLLACCLETKRPILVYEWVVPQTLKDKTVELEWEDRLRIAWEISHATAYLHTAFPRPIVHRELTPNNVLLDQGNSAKMCNFSLCASIPEGKDFVQEQLFDYDTYDVFFMDQMSHMAPEKLCLGRVAESSDVYSFGILLLMLLTGKNSSAYRHKYFGIKNNFCINEMVDPVLITRNKISSIKRLQLETSIKLALQCVARKGDQRPSMVNIATVLKNMITSPEFILHTSSFKIEHDIGILLNRSNYYLNDDDVEQETNSDIELALPETEEDMRMSLERSLSE